MNRVGKTTVVLALAVFFALSGTLSLFAEGQQEEAYPSKPVTVVCTFPAGGLADIITRLFAQTFEDELGVPFQVVNRPGGAMIPGSMSVLDEPADGYTLTFASAPSMLTLPYINNSPYSHEDFDWLFILGQQKNVLYVPADSEFETLQDFVDAARSETPIVSTNALGAPPTLSMAQFVQSIGIEVEYLAEGTVPAAIVAAIGGHADAAMGQLTQLAQYPDEVRALAILDSSGHELLPGVPTAAEALPGLDVVATSWVRSGIAVKKGTPQEAIDVLLETAEKVLTTDEFKQAFADSGNVYDYASYDETQRIIQAGVDFYRPTIDSLGLRKE